MILLEPIKIGELLIRNLVQLAVGAERDVAAVVVPGEVEHLDHLPAGGCIRRVRIACHGLEFGNALRIAAFGRGVADVETALGRAVVAGVEGKSEQALLARRRDADRQERRRDQRAVLVPCISWCCTTIGRHSNKCGCVIKRF